MTQDPVSATKWDAEVLVVGAGPTGLTAAAVLAGSGVRTLVLDAHSAGANTSRAAVIHAHTLEVLEQIGVTDRLVRRGVHANRFSIRDRDRVLVNVPFDRLPTRFPYTLMISQAESEAVLRDRLGELGGEVQWNSSVERVTQDASGVTALLEGGHVLRARYVIGADGMHSKVRESASISFDGESYAQSFSLADVHLTGGAPREEVILYFSPAGLVVVAPLPDGVHRIVATIDSAPEHPDREFVQGLLDTRGPARERAVVEQVLWGSRFRVHHRIAARFHAGRILLAGDAAHVHSPAGGQGMNTGIKDGAAAAHALHSALTTGSDEALTHYDALRRPVAERVVGLADRLTRLATMSPAFRPLRNTALYALSHVPAFRNRLALQLSGLAFRRDGVGSRSPGRTESA